MKNTYETSEPTAAELFADLRTLVGEAEKLLVTSASEHTAEAVSALRARFDATYERLAGEVAIAKGKIAAGAKCTDKTVRANPYQSIAVAAGAGLLLGILLGRRTK